MNAQYHTVACNGKTETIEHPITYASCIFQGSQLNWATLIKETYALSLSLCICL